MADCKVLIYRRPPDEIVSTGRIWAWDLRLLVKPYSNAPVVTGRVFYKTTGGAEQNARIWADWLGLSVVDVDNVPLGGPTPGG